MAAKKRGLGRGLDALLGGDLSPDAASAADAGELRELALGVLTPGRYQPRTHVDDDALESLAQSIRTQGIVQPLVVRSVGKQYEIIAGERRWRAAKIAGLEVVPAVVRDVPDAIAMAVALIENIQREDLNPLEEATALKRLISDCKMTHQQCADAIGRSRASVSNLLRLTELDEEIQDFLRQGRLEMGHGRALLGAEAGKRVALARIVVARALSVRQTESLVKASNSGDAPPPAKPAKSAKITRLEQGLAERLGMAVNIKPGKGGRGRVVIEYRDSGLLEDLIKRLD